ncbi:hypothetical protein QJS04_geneDACA024940 [Acorus gramineus]|uniref:DUF659 domain-containing protein n=1 Tax=Acorus gramineus TaxID=55184 RepID=A0AAV9A0N1_ACOGR|nr:hypothetical protein QJS04_geneDACA024940 [Acorus gramineus]
MSSSGASSSNLRPANTKDPAWKYGEYKSATEKHIVKCLLCSHLCSGGITRLKEHILHSPGANAKPCPRTTPEIRKEIEEFMNKKSEIKCRRGSFYSEDFARDIGDQQPHVGDDDIIEIGGPSSRPPPSKQRRKNTRGPMDLFCRGNVEDVVDQRLRGGPGQQTTLENRLKKEERKNAIQKIARWAITAGVSFHALTSRSFHVALEAIGRFGSGLAPPSMHEISETCLQEEVRETHKILEIHKGHWKTYGCTLMCDGWTDRRQRSLINFLANSPKGTMFLKSIDASAHSHTAIFLFKEINDVIENIIGKENVVQIVTDNAANYKAACQLVIERHPTIFWTPCAAHCIDLILEDIGKMHIRTISLARRITVFIYAHTQLLHCMRLFCNGDIVRPGPTRFATSFLTLQSLWEHKNALRTLMVADEWTKSKWCNLRTGKQTERTILSVQFWKGVQRALHAAIPLVHVLRLVDGDEKPSMGYLYNAMDRAKEKIKENYQYRPLQYGPVIEVIEGRWSSQMSSDLYHAGFVLNPGVWFKTADRDAAVQTHMLRCVQAMAKMEPDPEVEDRLQKQLDNNYRKVDRSVGEPS